MDNVEAAHIAYAAVLVSLIITVLTLQLMFASQARFGISSQLCWSEKDSRFNYWKFYYIVVDLIDECEDAKWKEDVLKHYNMHICLHV